MMMKESARKFRGSRIAAITGGFKLLTSYMLSIYLIHSKVNIKILLTSSSSCYFATN